MKGHWTVSILASILILGGIGFPQHVFAEVIYESATLGPTGLDNGIVLSTSQFLGSRFSVTETFEVTAIGGHMFSGNIPTLFGAIVDMSGPLPAGSPFTGGEVLASTVFTANDGFSTDFSTPLSVTLPPGDYALVFGSGEFGATGGGRMTSNNFDTPTGSGSYFFWDSVSWGEGTFDSARFTVNGDVVEIPVGGTALPIDTTALLVAGAQTTTPWLILGVIAAVGIGLAVFTLKRNKN